MKIKKNDKVLVIKGKDKGKTGKADKIFISSRMVLVGGINMYKKNVKPSKKYPQGGIIDIYKPLHVENVMVICPRCNKPTRAGYSLTGTKKIRICKKCKELLDVAS